MKNRNVLFFVIGSMILLGGQFWLTSRYAKPAPRIETQQHAPAAPKAPETPAAPAALTGALTGAQGEAPATGGAQAADPAATHTLATEELSLTWQVATGALKQVLWRRDGTRFFAEGVTVSLRGPA